MPQPSSGSIFRFGLFEADSARNTLTRAGVRQKIQDQPFRALILLLQRQGEVVTREELRQGLWPEGTHVDFDGSLNAVLKKLRTAIQDDSDNPRFIETVPRRGYRFIAPVSVSEVPAQSATAGADAGRQTIEPVTLPLPGKWPRSRKTYASAALLLLVAIAAGWASWRAEESKPHRTTINTTATPQSPVRLRKTVAVLGFQNVSGRPADAWLSTALSEMLGTELTAEAKLRLASGEDVSNLRRSSPWPQTGTLDRPTTARIGADLSSDLLVLGSYTAMGDTRHERLRVDARVQDAKTGEILTEAAQIGNAGDLFALVSNLGSKLRQSLGLPQLKGPDQTGVMTALPRDPDAARLYALGIEKLRQSDASGAKDLLEQVTLTEPKFALAHTMLARAYAGLGYEQKRRTEAKKALDVSANLPAAQRMLVEGDYYGSIADYVKAISVYHALFELYPDNVDYGILLAGTQLAAGHGSEAAVTIARLRQLPPPASEDARIDLAEAKVVNNKTDALALVDRALKKTSSPDKRLLYAEARRQQCLGTLYGPTPEQAPPACEDAYRIFLSAGNRLAAADCVRLLADHEGSQGHFELAIARYRQALGLLQSLSEHEKTGAVLNNMAINFANEGNLKQAENEYRLALADFKQAGDRLNESVAIGNLADIVYLRGNLDAAAKLYDQALQIQASFDPGSPGYLLYRLADLRLTQGRVEEADRLARRAIAALPPEQGGYQYRTGAMLVLGRVLEAEGKFAAAGAQIEETLAIRQKMGEMDLAAESQAALAELALRQKRPVEAEDLLRKAIAEFEKEKDDPSASSAYASLSQALLMEGKLNESRNAVQRSVQLSHTNSDPALTLSAAVQQARVEVADPALDRSGRLRPARELHSAASRANNLGYFDVECEARLVLGELEMTSNPASGRALLTALVSKTRGRGFELLAREAEEYLAQADEVHVGQVR